jgi:hypothetical protein
MWIADEVSGALGNIAMVNYPYPANLIGNLPANPVNDVCAKCFQSSAEQKLSI